MWPLRLVGPKLIACLLALIRQSHFVRLSFRCVFAVNVQRSVCSCAATPSRHVSDKYLRRCVHPHRVNPLQCVAACAQLLPAAQRVAHQHAHAAWPPPCTLH